jgi:flagellar biosynthesis/type III secretory pathway protein FliH
MGQIVLKVPKRKYKVQLIQSETILNDIILERQERMKKKFGFDAMEELLEIQRAEEEKKRKEEEEEKEFQELRMILTEEKADAFDFAEEIDENEIKEGELLDETDIFDDSEVSMEELLKEDYIREKLKNDPEIDIPMPEDRLPIPKTIFTEIYSISETSEPVPIIHSEEKNTIELEVAEKYIQNAYDRGYEDCQEIASLNAQSKISEAHKNVRRIDKLMLELRKHYASKLLKFNEELIELSCIIAESIIENEISRDNNIVLKQIEKTVAELNDDTVFDITINTEDAEILEKTNSVFFKNSKTFASTSILTDNSIERGGCIFRTSSGNIDITIGTQINKIKAELKMMSDAKKANTMPFANENIPEIEAVSEKFLEQIDSMKEDEDTVKENDTTVKEDNITVEENNTTVKENNTTVKENNILDDDIAISDDGIVDKK